MKKVALFARMDLLVESFSMFRVWNARVLFIFPAFLVTNGEKVELIIYLLF